MDRDKKFYIDHVLTIIFLLLSGSSIVYLTFVRFAPFQLFILAFVITLALSHFKNWTDISKEMFIVLITIGSFLSGIMLYAILSSGKTEKQCMVTNILHKGLILLY